jgi:glycine receptor alpha-3
MSNNLKKILHFPNYDNQVIERLLFLKLIFITFIGNYSRLVCELEFVRSMGYYLIQIYIPASLIVIISWVSFWLHRVCFTFNLIIQTFSAQLIINYHKVINIDE